MNRATLLLHGGRAPNVSGDPGAPPVAPSVNDVSPAGVVADERQARYGSPTTSDTLARRLAALEGTEDALVLASGMGAIACTMLALLRAGDHLVASAWLYGGARRFVQEELPSMGIEVTFIDPTETRAWRRAMRRNTRVLFLESPVNPTTRVVDLRPARMLAQEHGVALVVDSTFATPVNCRPVEHGADVVIHSATKYLNGHHDVLAGVVCGAEPLIEEVRTKMAMWGQAPDPFAVWLLERGLKTLDVRVRRQNQSALQIAQWAAMQPAIRAVHYPGLTSHPDHEIATSVLEGFGGMLAIELAGGAAAVERLVSRLTLFRSATTLGGVESLVSEPRLSSHQQLSAEELGAMGIPDGFLRISVGLEHVDDLIADLVRALEA